MSLLYWWPFTKDGSNQGLRQTNDLSITINSNGKIGKCALLTSSTSLQILSTSPDIDIYTQTGSELSYAFWLKIDSEYLNSYIASATFTDTKKSINNCIIGFNGSTSSIGFCLYCRANDLTNSSIITSVPVVMGLRHSSSNNLITLDELTLDTWHHIVLTYSGTIMKGYIDGEYKNSKSIARNALASTKTLVLNSGSFFAGTSNNFFNISLKEYFNDVRIYNHALSPKEVKEISKGLVLHYKLDHGGLGGENIITNSTGYLGTTHWSGLVTQAIDTDGRPYLIAKRTDTTSTSRTFCTHTPAITSYVASWTPGSKFTISGYYKVPSSETQETGGNMFIRWSKASASNGDTDTGFTTSTAVKDTWIRFENTYTVPPNWDGSTNAANFYISAFAAQKRATVYWKDLKMELGEKATPWSPAKADSNYPTNFDTTIYDCSGYGNNGTVIGTLNAVADSPRYEVATVFNGTDSAIKVTNNNWCSQGMEALTINIWAKASSWSAKKLFSCTDSGGFNTESGSSGYLRFPVHVYTNTEKTSTAYKYDSKEIKISDLSTTDWVMITFVYDLTGTKTYINGELHHTYENVSYGIHFNMNTRLFLGCEANIANPSTPYLDGQESDFRIYATALSAAAIKELYDTSGSVDSNGNVYARELVEL